MVSVSISHFAESERGFDTSNERTPWPDNCDEAWRVFVTNEGPTPVRDVEIFLEGEPLRAAVEVNSEHGATVVKALPLSVLDTQEIAQLWVSVPSSERRPVAYFTDHGGWRWRRNCYGGLASVDDAGQTRLT